MSTRGFIVVLVLITFANLTAKKQTVYYFELKEYGRVAEWVIPLGLAFRVAKKFVAVLGELLLLGTNYSGRRFESCPDHQPPRKPKFPAKERLSPEIYGLLAGKL
jgi:hypothetical protein